MEDDGRFTDLSANATAVTKTPSSEEEAEAAAAGVASKYTTPTRSRRHGIAVKVVVASAAVSGVIWGLTSVGSAPANDTAALLMNTSTKTSKSPVVQAKSKVGKEVSSLRHAMFICCCCTHVCIICDN